MDRHVEFATQLSRLVALYAHPQDDRTSEKAALRAARAAAKHGAVELSMDESVLRAGSQDLDDSIPNVPMLRGLFVALGIARVHVAHQAGQDEIKALAKLFGAAVEGDRTPESFAAALGAREWTEVGVELTVAAAAAVGVAGDDEEATAALPEGEHQAATSPEDAPPSSDLAPDSTAAAPAEPLPAAPAKELPVGKPIATTVPASVLQIADERFRELFERLIGASEPGTLRRFLDPVQLCVEQEARDGHMSVALQILNSMVDCEELCTDAEMRRQFVVTFRRLTKPTLLRALAALYVDDPAVMPLLDRVLARFGEDGAEAVADRAACATTAEARAAYLQLLGRLPSARDAVVSMLFDDRPHVVERGIEFVTQLRVSDGEKVLAEQLAHASPRVRRAAAQGLGTYRSSAFAVDALLRALTDVEADVRLTAVVALQGRRESRLASPLVQRIDDEPELDVQLAIVTALGRLAAPEGVQKLIALSMPDQRLLRRRDASVLRLSAIEAMGEARTPQAMVTLQKLLEDSQKEVREAAARLYTRARRQTTTGSIPTVSEP